MTAPKRSKREFDVFLSHHSEDKAFVRAVAGRLVDEAALRVFLDEWQLIAGVEWQPELERALEQSVSCAVFVGTKGLGRWQAREMRAMLDEQVHDRNYRLIPVLLPGVDPTSRGTLPLFLRGVGWVDFRKGSDDQDAFQHLVAAVRGKPPGRKRNALATLLEQLSQGNSLERQEAAEMIGQAKDHSAVAFLERRWDDEEDFTVRHWIALALGTIGGNDAAAALERLHNRETDPFARLGIDIALKRDGKED